VGIKNICRLSDRTKTLQTTANKLYILICIYLYCFVCSVCSCLLRKDGEGLSLFAVFAVVCCVGIERDGGRGGARGGARLGGAKE
jgi:hypothetical protein